MKLLQKGISIGEIIFQTQLAQHGADRLAAASNDCDKLAIWSAVQTILCSAGNISKILWPKEKYKERGIKLRKLLNVDDENILRQRTFRNKLEHYDELVDEFFTKHEPVSYRDFVMNPSLQSFEIESCHRGYNSFNNTLVIRGQILDLNALFKALKAIESSCYRGYTPITIKK